MLRPLLLATLLCSSAAQARDWTVDAARSTLGFKGSYQGEGFAGTFGKFDAKIAYDAADVAKSSFDVSVDLASANTGSAERDDSLKGGDFFAVAKFPKARFATQSFAKAADGSVTAQGTLTIRDQSKPVTLKVTFTEAGGGATLDVDTVLKRADFGLGSGSDWSDVGADVPGRGHLVLTAKGGAARNRSLENPGDADTTRSGDMPGMLAVSGTPARFDERLVHLATLAHALRA